MCAGGSKKRAKAKKAQLPVSLLNSIPTFLEISELPKNLRLDLENLGAVEEASNENMEKVLRGLKKYMKDEIKRALEEGRAAEEKQKSEEFLKRAVAVLKYLMEARDLSSSHVPVRFFCLIAPFLISDALDPALRNKMSQVCEKMVVDMREEVGASLILSVYLVTCGNLDSRRIWYTLKHTLPRLGLSSPPCQALVEALFRLSVDKKFITSKEGRQVTAVFMSSEKHLVKPLHQKIVNSLLNLPKGIAANYAEVYHNAWNYATDEVKKEIEENCIQDLMIKVMTLKRKGSDFAKAGQWVFAILSKLHHQRRMFAFSSVITKLYMPILWRTLRSGNPIERCNAAQVFLDVFPLEKPNTGFVANQEYKEKQIKEIMDLLMDHCHLVRIITIKGVCKQMRSSLECWNIGEVRATMTALADDLANDGAHWTVREAVWRGLTVLSESEPPRQILALLLPQLASHLHDDHPKVRKAFINMLIALKAYPDVPRYFHITPADHLAARLELEGKLVGEALAKLLLPDIVNKDMALGKVVARLKRLVITNSIGAKKLFAFSRNVLQIQDVYTIIIGVLADIRNKARDLLEMSKTENIENNCQEASEGRPRKKRKTSGALQDISNENNGGEQCEGVSERAVDLRNDSNVLLKGMLDCCSILWSVFEAELNKDVNAEKREDMYKMACLCVPTFLRAFKGTAMYYATVIFASLIPINKLQPVSTISGACLSELKERVKGNSKELQCLVYSLCSWNRGHEVIELAMEWLDPAFRPYKLNLTAFQKEGKRKTRVRFKINPGRPLLALKLLDTVFSDYAYESRLLVRTYDQIYELYIYLNRCKILIEKRLEKGSPLEEEDLSDEFLCKSLERSLLLGLTLHRPDKPPGNQSLNGNTSDLQPFHWAHTSQADMVWVLNILVPRLSFGPASDDQDEQTFASKCVNAVFKVARLVVSLNLTLEEQCNDLARFTITLLKTDCSRWFMEEAGNVLMALTLHAETYTEKDEWYLFDKTLPHLYQVFLEMLYSNNISSDSVNQYFQEIRPLRFGVIALPFSLQRLYGSRNKHYVRAYNTLIESCLEVICKSIRHMDGEVEFGDKLEDQPYFVTVCIGAILGKPPLSNDLFSSILQQFMNQSDDSYMLASCVSLLNTAVHSHGSKVEKVNLEKILIKAYSLFKTKTRDIQQKPPSDDSFASNSEHFDVVKVCEPIFFGLSQHVGCSLTPTTRSNPVNITAGN